MAFIQANLTPLGGQSARGVAPQLWGYRTADAHATVDSAGYFDNGTTTNTGMRNIMNIGDIIYVTVERVIPSFTIANDQVLAGVITKGTNASIISPGKNMTIAGIDGQRPNRVAQASIGVYPAVAIVDRTKDTVSKSKSM